MLPRLLCEELCSLNPMTDKLTFSVIWKLTPEGKVVMNSILSFILYVRGLILSIVVSTVCLY